jgi:hypothetical protein
MKKKLPKKKTATKKAVKKPAKKVAAKKPTKRVAPAKAKKPSMPLFAKHVHPYGTTRHDDLSWQTTRFEQQLGAFDEARANVIRSALAFASARHEGQRRFDGTAFVIHPVRIANILITEWSVNNPDMIAAALLHDVVEDTQTTLKEIKDSFGNDIGKLVDGMTMWKGSETYETYIKRVSRGPEPLRMIKCADVLDNLRSWHETDTGEFPRWWRNASELVLPMARSVDDEGTAAFAIHKVLNDPWYLKRAGME